MGSDQIGIYFFCAFKLFLSTLPAWGATSGFFNSLKFTDISIHAPRVGSDQMQFPCQLLLTYFYPRSPRGERREYRSSRMPSVRISIHAPRVGSDYFSARRSYVVPLFLSTLPAWGATVLFLHNLFLLVISIHAPRVGSDNAFIVCFLLFFNISIHAPRVGSDAAIAEYSAAINYFYPRSPRGERRIPLSRQPNRSRFLSTLPAWGATLVRLRRLRRRYISIHAPRVGSDKGMNRPR